MQRLDDAKPLHFFWGRGSALPEALSGTVDGSSAITALQERGTFPNVCWSHELANTAKVELMAYSHPFGVHRRAGRECWVGSLTRPHSATFSNEQSLAVVAS